MLGMSTFCKTSFFQVIFLKKEIHCLIINRLTEMKWNEGIHGPTWIFNNDIFNILVHFHSVKPFLKLSDEKWAMHI